jgi:flavin reductase (DIM6/NTAB) family NADH-FMN oxidoreductase RutF
VLGTLAGKEPRGMTVNSFITVSLEPLLVLASVHNESRTFGHLRTSGVFSITVLSAGQERVARWFADPTRPDRVDSLAEVTWRPGPATGAPVFLDGVCYFDCVVERMHLAGDHTIVIGAVLAFDVLAAEPPLLFAGSRFADVAEREPSVPGQRR